MNFKKLSWVVAVLMHAGLWSVAGARSLSSDLGPLAVVLEDFSDMVTLQDASVNDFSGNMGVINKDDLPFGKTSIISRDGRKSALKFDWDFSNTSDEIAFTGLFFSLFGLSDANVSFDGISQHKIRFDEHSLDLDRLDGVLSEAWGERKAKAIWFEVLYNGKRPVHVRLELKDTAGRAMYTRIKLSPCPNLQKVAWPFRNEKHRRQLGGFPDLRQAKMLTCMVERRHQGDRIQNPDSASLEFNRIWFECDRPENQPLNDEALLDLVQRRALQYFFDWGSRKPQSRGIPQDRSSFGDLLTVGGVGFALPAHVIAAERGWMKREETARRVVSVLRILDNPDAFGPEPVGRLGYKGWFYHYLGVDGRRRQNADQKDTLEDESLNTVELSTIDTALALMGVLTAKSYYSRNEPVEAEIRQRAQSIVDRVEWDFMIEPESGQFYLGWKPSERRDGPAFDLPSADGKGGYSGAPGHPMTLDYYTDEASLLALLALGHGGGDVPLSVWTAWVRQQDEGGLVRSYPGSLFTFQFLHAFLDTRTTASPSSEGGEAIQWFNNSRRAMWRAIQHASRRPAGFKTYGPDAWGVSAVEGPLDEYHAYGLQPLAVDPQPAEDGTVSYYAMLSAASYGSDLRQRALSSVRRGWARGHWHGRFGLPDAFNDEIAEALRGRAPAHCIRSHGPWVQRTLFAINQGPMLLHLENARSGLIWKLLGRNEQIQTALSRIRDPQWKVAQR